MTQERASLGFGSELDEIDKAAWPPRQAETQPRNPVVDRQLAAAAGFKSREVPADPPPLPMYVRRRRTGRNHQLNLKVRPQDVAMFYAIADAHEWGLGETFERAVELLEREFGRQS